MVKPVYHYTCDHGRDGILGTGRILPTAQLVGAQALSRMPAWQRAVTELVWLTDLADPMRDALGLTSHTISCDRTRHRFRVVDYRPARYTAVRRDLPERTREAIESTPGVLLAHWWVAYTPVPAAYDPIGGGIDG